MPDRPAGFFREGGKVKPRHVKKGINEADLSIKEKGAGEKIEVNIHPEKNNSQPRTIEDMDEYYKQKEHESVERLFNEQKNNPNLDILKPYITYYFGGAAMIDNMPAKEAEKLLNKERYIQANYKRTEWAPTQEEMINLVKENNGRLEGIWVPSQSGRSDFRLEFTGMTIDIPREKAEKYAEVWSPDEFSKVNNGYRFWWD